MRDRAFALGSLLLVVGVMAAIAVPSLLTARQRSRQKRTMADMRTIATAWEARASETSTYYVGPGAPSLTAQDAKDFAQAEAVDAAIIERALEPTYVRELPLVDGWGNPFELRIANLNEKGQVIDYAIRSLGSDGKADRQLYTQRTVGSSEFEADLVFASGSFVQYLEGT